MADAYLSTENTVYREVEKAILSGDMPKAELASIFRRFIQARSAPPPESATVAAAKQELHVHLDD